MTSHLTYHATQARLDELLRDAAHRPRATSAGVRSNPVPPPTLRHGHRRLGQLGRVLRGLGPRPATR
jgi:hypothetical protein